MPEVDALPCPCPDAHRRLQDVHEHLHRAMDAYADPDDFRMEVNSFITHARSVTFLLQKRKASLLNFADWYDAWTLKSKQNPVLRWSVSARNRVVKEEDLETLSSMRLTFYGERLAEMSEELEVAPALSTEAAAQQLIDHLARKGVKPPAWMRIERKWVDRELPGHEICGAFREILSRLTEVVRCAHDAHGIDGCTVSARKRPCVTAALPLHYDCLGSGNPMASVLVDPRSGEALSGGFRLDSGELELTPEMRTRIVATYEHAQLPPKLRDQTNARMRMIRRFLEDDGLVVRVLLLEGVHDEIRNFRIDFEANRPREDQFEQVVESQGGWDFHTALMVSEAWLYSEGGVQSMIDLGGRSLLTPEPGWYDGPRFANAVEALKVDMVDRDGVAVALTQPFARTDEGIVFGEIERRDGVQEALPMMRPLWRTWPAWKDWKMPRMGPTAPMDGSSFRRRPGTR